MQLDGSTSFALEVLLERGRSLYRDAAAHARKMLREQGELPIVDAVRVDATAIVVETLSMPLLPIVRKEDITRFGRFMFQLAAWHVELVALWHNAQERIDHEDQE